MRTFPENFDCFCSFEAWYGAPKVTESVTGTGKVLTVPVRNLPIGGPGQGAHPLFGNGEKNSFDKAVRRHPSLGYVVDGFMVFRGVFLSRREMGEYIGNPMNPEGFRDDYVIKDVDLALGGEVLKLYPLEGRIDEPPACVTWDIIARSFELQVE